ncbi:sulfate adenylyltransferase subunit CysD [Saprospiraceae bacterium]|nr:sulfate adenylyltransferase subunit CysD [Saprospiraceae bacterium]
MAKEAFSYLDELESESIFILREVFAEFKNPVLLFSGGKDSILMIHLAIKAFAPSKIPFPLMHVDTGHNFPETIAFRDQLVKDLEVENLIVASVEESIKQGKVLEETGQHASRNLLQIRTLLDAIQTHSIDCAIGGGRRDEEKSRAKERIFSHRNKEGEWDPKNQRPELWDLYNSKYLPDEHFRIFPISNWTELDVWSYFQREKIEFPSLYLAKERKVVRRNNTWIPYSEYLELQEHEKIEIQKVRFRTLGDITITGGIESDAENIEQIIQEVASLKITERGNRADDKRSDTAMEERKRKGYF